MKDKKLMSKELMRKAVKYKINLVKFMRISSRKVQRKYTTIFVNRR